MNRILLTLLPLALLLSCSATDREINQSSPSQQEFSTHIFTHNNITLPYRMAHIGSGTSRAMVLYLHGGSSKGNDNTTQLSEPAITTIAEYIATSGIVADIIVPQCPADKSWGKNLNAALRALTEQNNYTCLYLFGGSMGGTGCWSFISSYPATVTAAMIVAGNPSGAKAENVAHTAVYTVMGSEDKLVNIDAVTTFVESLTLLNAPILFDIEQGWSHAQTCIDSYTTPRLDWVFKHT